MQIMVVEDNDRVATLLKKGLESQGYAVDVYDNAEIAIAFFSSKNYNLVITDIMLPEMNGIDLSKYLKINFPTIPIIMLTALGTIDEKIKGFDAGADDYMVKPFDLRELFARVRAILQRKSTSVFESDLVEQIEYDDLKIDLKTNDVYRGGIRIDLTPKEFKLLYYMVLHKERILTRDEIAENVWGNSFDTGTNYIDVYVTYIRKKIDKNFNKKLIHTKAGVGFIFSNQL